MMPLFFRSLTLLLLALAITLPAQADDDQPVAQSVEDLRRQVIQLNRDLFVLEEDLLFPASTQFAVFLSVDAGEFLRIDSVKLKVGNTIVASHLYTDRQVDALQRGGMQRLYMGNLRTGTHEVTVFVEGIGPENRAYKKAATRQLEKGTDTATLEVRISDRSADYQPVVELVEWE
ncbi:AraC family transcriptional regulator [uncultured Marinobacter sp.]|uniref:AraC family transcriptional regulator n=1 Tax=uncultured Marinobacter sp. TaxID=187379 RepID=UPI0030D9E05E